MAPEPSWLKLLESACAIDSRTRAAPDGATRVAELFGQELVELGFELSWFDAAPEEGPRGRHLRAVRRGSDAGSPRLLLMGHTDTVLSPVDVPWRVDEASGRIFGSGVCDMKGGCVLLIEALRQAIDSSAAVAGAGLEVLLNSTEEVAGPSFRELARRLGAGASACLGFEPARLGADGRYEFVVSRKGVRRFTLTCTGRAAHSGIDHAYGISAIREVARKIDLLESLTDYSRDLTLNVGTIVGGRAPNQVADHCEASFDLRAYDRQVLDAAAAQARHVCAEPTLRSPHDGAIARLHLSEYASYPAWSGNAASAALGRRYAAIAAHHGLNTAAVASGGGADASHVADLTPTIDGLGILGGKLHQPGEWADSRSFPLLTRAAADLIVELCHQTEGDPSVREMARQTSSNSERNQQ